MDIASTNPLTHEKDVDRGHARSIHDKTLFTGRSERARNN